MVNTLFGQIWSKKPKLSVLSWNLVPRLIWICRIQWWCSLFFVFYRKHPYWRTKVKKGAIFVPANWSREFEISSCHQHSFFIFCGECVRGLFLGTSIKYFGIIQKEKQTFYFIWINFLLKIKFPDLDWTFCVIWINLLLMKHKLINLDQIVNNSITC